MRRVRGGAQVIPGAPVSPHEPRASTSSAFQTVPTHAAVNPVDDARTELTATARAIRTGESLTPEAFAAQLETA